MKKNPIKQIYRLLYANESGFDILNSFVLDYGLKVMPETLRKRLKKVCKNYPVINLEEITKAFQSWNIAMKPIKVSLKDLKKIQFPNIVVLKEKDSYSYGLLNTNGTNLLLYRPFGEIEIIELREFEKFWTGITFVYKISKVSGEKRYTEKKKLLESQRQQYINSIRSFEHFIEDELCDYIIDYCEANHLFTRSKVGAADLATSEIRTSQTAFLVEDRNINLTLIKRKIAKTLKILETQIETLQCVKYAENQEFKIHYDTGFLHQNRRKLTCLIYLNDNFTGGETDFPLAAVKFKPSKGKMIVFKNLKKSGELEPLSAHTGTVVQRGIKYACNIWIRENPILTN